MLSTTFRYALISLVEIAAQSGLRAAVIAERHQLSPRYVATVLSDLRRLGFVINIKGRNGGYHLAKPADSISLLDLHIGITGQRHPLGPNAHGPHAPVATESTAGGLGDAGAGPSTLSSSASWSQGFSGAPGDHLPPPASLEGWIQEMEERWLNELDNTSLKQLADLVVPRQA